MERQMYAITSDSFGGYSAISQDIFGKNFSKSGGSSGGGGITPHNLANLITLMAERNGGSIKVPVDVVHSQLYASKGDLAPIKTFPTPPWEYEKPKPGDGENGSTETMTPMRNYSTARWPLDMPRPLGDKPQPENTNNKGIDGVMVSPSTEYGSTIYAVTEEGNIGYRNNEDPIAKIKIKDTKKYKKKDKKK